MKVIFEPKIQEHDPSLYQSDKIANTINGWAAINEEVIRQYEKDGYLIVSNAYSKDEVALAKKELADMTLAEDPRCESVYYEGDIRSLINIEQDNTKDEKGKQLAMGSIGENLPQLPPETRASFVRKFMGFTSTHPPLGRLASNAELLHLISKLTSTKDVALFQEMAMIKPPGGREKPWHQDHAYFNYPINTSIIGVWIALGDVNEENGCMYLLPGMHKQGPILHFMRRDWQICDSEIYGTLAGKRVCAPMKAGDVLIFDSKLPHGTPKNNTDDYRWAVQLHYKGTRTPTCEDEQRLELFGSEGKNVSC
jgi:phytanoyl-CoA hydroxylase